MGEQKKRKMSFLSVLLIQGAVVVYTGSSVCSKIASSHPGSITLFGLTLHWLSWTGVLWVFLELCCLGAYAVFWQQIIKRLPLTTAFANKAVTVVWGIVWGALFFGEAITLGKVLGAALVISGVILFVRGDSEEARV